MDELPTSPNAGVHLVVLIHGLYGSPANLAVVNEEVHRAASTSSISQAEQAGPSSPYDGGYAESETEVDQLLSEPGPLDSSSLVPGPEVVTLLVNSFTGSHTWDGIDINAHRARRELLTKIDELESQGSRVEGISIMAYSLGGLVGRYLVGLLESTGFWDTYTPICFSTAATPHLGVLKYKTRVNAVVHTIGKRLFSRSGQQLYNLDKYDGTRSLLEVMAAPGGVFVRGLKRFPRIMIVANGCHDATVPYPTASISATDPFDSFHRTGLEVQADHRNVLASYSYPEKIGAMTITSTVDLREYKGMDGVMRRRPRLPPILFLPFPFTYLLPALLPLILPLWFLFASCIMIYHTYQSRQRHRLHRVDMEPIPPLAASSSSAAEMSRVLSSDISSNGHMPEPHTESTPLLGALPASSAPMSRTGTPPLHPSDVVSTPPSIDSTSSDVQESHRPGQIRLLLTPQQKAMVKHLNEGLPQMVRLIGWFPWAFNAHALLIVRDKKRFPWHEEGRGVVRAWAEYVVESPQVLAM